VTSAAPSAVGAEAVQVEELFRHHADFVARFLGRLGAGADEIDDLVQEVFLTAHRRGGFVPGSAKPTTWLAEIALRVASNARRSRRRSRVAADEESVAAAVSDADGPFESAAHAESTARVQRALEALDFDRRVVFVLYELEAEPCDAIAACLSIPVGTVYSRLHAARREFVRAYQRLSAEPERHRVEQGGAA